MTALSVRGDHSRGTLYGRITLDARREELTALWGMMTVPGIPGKIECDVVEAVQESSGSWKLAFLPRSKFNRELLRLRVGPEKLRAATFELEGTDHFYYLEP